MVVDNIIPSNQYGNLEVWEGNPKLLPVGTTLIAVNPTKHISMKTLKDTAEFLGIQYIPAVVGFEKRTSLTDTDDDSSSRYTPKFGGIVVLASQVMILEDALYFQESRREETLWRMKQEVVYRRWEKLMTSLLSRVRLKETYGY